MVSNSSSKKGFCHEKWERRGGQVKEEGEGRKREGERGRDGV